jgi:hypothetical protein
MPAQGLNPARASPSKPSANIGRFFHCRKNCRKIKSNGPDHLQLLFQVLQLLAGHRDLFIEFGLQLLGAF